jgi:2-phospho-L-lactate/phosphoenolpyruvate guanylyltransferase
VSTAVVVLARDPRGGKTRLRRALTPAVRRSLALAMFDDVLAAALATGWDVLVVTDTRALAARARNAGARAHVVAARGTRDAARHGLDRVTREGASDALVLAADLPLVRPADLRRVAAAGRRSEVVIVPDHERVGTNALYLRPPTRIAPRFGSASLKAHRAAAGAAGRTLAIARLGLDVDTPNDLDRLRRSRRSAGSRTRAVLAASSLRARR